MIQPIKPRGSHREITVMSAILCLVVIYFHVLGEAVIGYQKDSIQFAISFYSQRLCAITVPCFTFISALKYFIRFGEGRDFKYGPFILGRAKRIYLPYLLWTAIHYAYFLYRQYFPFNIQDFLGYAALGSVSYQYYFIIIIMQFYLLMPVWRAIRNAKKTLVPVIVAAGGLLGIFISVYAGDVIAAITGGTGFRLPYADRYFVSYLAYWLLGLYCGTHYDSVLAFIRRHRPVFILSYVIFGGLHATLYYFFNRNFFYYSYAEAMQVPFCITAIFMMLTLSDLLTQKIPKILPTLQKLAGASFYIYLSHSLVLLHTDYIMGLAGLTSITVRLGIKMILTFVIPVTLSLAYVWLKKMIMSPRTSPSP
ncbi:MAG: acyltransferase [Clostridiales bacterium]|nr:acyltransferase [Clostridiales bacterium]